MVIIHDVVGFVEAYCKTHENLPPTVAQIANGLGVTVPDLPIESLQRFAVEPAPRGCFLVWRGVRQWLDREDALLLSAELRLAVEMIPEPAEVQVEEAEPEQTTEEIVEKVTTGTGYKGLTTAGYISESKHL